MTENVVKSKFGEVAHFVSERFNSSGKYLLSIFYVLLFFSTDDNKSCPVTFLLQNKKQAKVNLILLWAETVKNHISSPHISHPINILPVFAPIYQGDPLEKLRESAPFAIWSGRIDHSGGLSTFFH